MFFVGGCFLFDLSPPTWLKLNMEHFVNIYCPPGSCPILKFPAGAVFLWDLRRPMIWSMSFQESRGVSLSLAGGLKMWGQDGSKWECFFLKTRDDLLCIYPCIYLCICIPSRELTYSTKREKENQFKKCLGGGYVSSQECVYIYICILYIILIDIMIFVHFN